MLESTEVKAVVLEHVTELLREVEVEHAEFGGSEALNAIGLTSLMLARLIIQLEMELGVDPFAEEELVISDVRTLDDLVEAYARSLRMHIPG